LGNYNFMTSAREQLLYQDYLLGLDVIASTETTKVDAGCQRIATGVGAVPAYVVNPS
jgi:hypothetical protein